MISARTLLEPILDVPQPVLVPEIQVVHDQVPLPENVVANDPININQEVGEEPIPLEKVLIEPEQQPPSHETAARYRSEEESVPNAVPKVKLHDKSSVPSKNNLHREIPSWQVNAQSQLSLRQVIFLVMVFILGYLNSSMFSEHLTSILQPKP